jgi:vancomycin permeability regulator SanA
MAPLRSRFWRKAPVAGLLAVMAVGSVVAPNLWVRFATRGRNYASVAEVPARAVAIVPGSRVNNGEPSPQLRERLEAALGLYRSGRVQAILVSGPDTIESPEASVMLEWLQARGVDRGAVWADEGGTRTRETMQRASALFGIESAIVCTQALHMWRSLYLAKQAGIDAVGVSLPTELSDSPEWVGREALKTTLAVAESQIRVGIASFPAAVVHHLASVTVR